ncbi:MAG: MBL fold metallo-hydrolase [Mangrovibacterium sp.]
MSKFKKSMFIFMLVVAAFFIGVYCFMHTAKFGKNPIGKDLQKVKQSPNYRDGQFHNLVPTPAMAEGENAVTYLRDLFFKKVDHKKPTMPIVTHKSDLKALNPNDNLLIWLGHGSYYMQIDGKRFLVDPVLVAASPVGFFGGAFKGSDVYTVEDMPKIDYLLITHDHWDHLDYDTVEELKHDKLSVICPLGIGSHFRHWQWNKEQIVELDWDEQSQLDDRVQITALPTRHFSGRGFARNKTLWASYMLETPLGNIYLSGDGGYASHFKAIKEKFGEIAFAVFENGQYDRKWANIHLMPKHLQLALADIQPKQFITVHNSKYALAQHDWREPLENIYSYTQNDSIKLSTPMIGDVVKLDEDNSFDAAWWRKSER